MIEVLQFIFQDFWHWAGTLILLSSIVSVITYVLAIMAMRH